MSNGRPPVGLVLGSALPPEDIPTVARRGEELGFGELWLAEDYFFTGGISGATAVLAQTTEVPVGLGIVSAMVRHPGVLAMEIATMARMYPGRVHPGIGLGVPAWIDQMGLTPPSQLGAMRECVRIGPQASRWRGVDRKGEVVRVQECEAHTSGFQRAGSALHGRRRPEDAEGVG